VARKKSRSTPLVAGDRAAACPHYYLIARLRAASDAKQKISLVRAVLSYFAASFRHRSLVIDPEWKWQLRLKLAGAASRISISP